MLHNTFVICCEPHLLLLILSACPRCYRLRGSCSSYSYQNNGIFMKRSLKFEWPIYQYYCTDVISECVSLRVCASLNAYARFLWEGRGMGFLFHPLLCFLLGLRPNTALCLSFTRTFIRLNHQTLCGLENWFSWKETPRGLFCFLFTVYRNILPEVTLQGWISRILSRRSLHKVKRASRQIDFQKCQLIRTQGAVWARRQAEEKSIFLYSFPST